MRITEKALYSYVSEINSIARARRKEQEIRLGLRNGAKHIDLVIPGMSGCLDTIFSGTARECWEFLRGLARGLTFK